MSDRLKQIMISKERLAKFKKIWKKEFREEISDQDALESATSLLSLMNAIYKPMTEREYEMLQKRRKETK